jgi:hypothetical protein
MKNETARREIESLDYYLQNHTDDYSEESHTAMMMGIQALELINKITDLLDGTIDHFDRDDAIDLLYEIKEVIR